MYLQYLNMLMIRIQNKKVSVATAFPGEHTYVTERHNLKWPGDSAVQNDMLHSVWKKKLNELLSRLTKD